MFIKALKGYIQQYMDTEKCTTLGCTYAKALSTKKKSNATYKNNNTAQGYKKPQEGREWRSETRGKDCKTPQFNKLTKKLSTVLNNISLTPEDKEEKQGKERGSLN